MHVKNFIPLSALSLLCLSGCVSMNYYQVKGYPIASGEFESAPDAPALVELKSAVIRIRAKSFNSYPKVQLTISGKAPKPHLEYIVGQIEIRTSDGKNVFRPGKDKNDIQFERFCGENPKGESLKSGMIRIEKGCKLVVAYVFKTDAAFWPNLDNFRLIDRGLEGEVIDVQLERRLKY
jgi:hypothetical protein